MCIYVLLAGINICDVSVCVQVYSGVIRKSSEEKFSYVIIQKRPKPGVLAPAGGSSSTGNRARNAGAVKEALSASFGQWLDRSPAPSSSAPAGEEVHPSPLAVLERFLDAPDEEAPQIVDQLIDEVSISIGNVYGCRIVFTLCCGTTGRLTGTSTSRHCTGRNGAASSGNIDAFSCIQYIAIPKASLCSLCCCRSPIKSKGHITLDVCTPEGRLVRNTVSRSNLHQIPSLYTAMRKTTWGGLFPVLAGGFVYQTLRCVV